MKVTVASRSFDVSDAKVTTPKRYGREPKSRTAEEYETFEVTFDIEVDDNKKERVAVTLFFKGAQWNYRVSHHGWRVDGIETIGRHLFASVYENNEQEFSIVIHMEHGDVVT